MKAAVTRNEVKKKKKIAFWATNHFHGNFYTVANLPKQQVTMKNQKAIKFKRQRQKIKKKKKKLQMPKTYSPN